MIIPAIIADDIKGVEEKIALVEGYVSWAQIDIMDGIFTPPTTWRNQIELQQINTDINLEVHLMIAKPEDTIDLWLASPIKRILVHYESTTPEKIKEIIAKINSAGKEVGISLKLETPISVLDDFFKDANCNISFIQLMSIAEIGHYGYPFDERVLEKISSLHAKYADVIIEVDGGVALGNASSLIQAGARNLVAGSSIFKSKNIKEAIEAFQQIL